MRCCITFRIMQKRIPVLVFAGFVTFGVAACRDRCNLDNAESPVDPIRTIRLLIRDSATGESLIGAARRFHPDSITYNSYAGFASPERIYTEAIGADTAILVPHIGTQSGIDCEGNPYPRRAGDIGTVFLHLHALDTDTLVVNVEGSGAVNLLYNGRTVLTTPYADNVARTVEIKK